MTLQQAHDAYNKQDYTTAFNIYDTLAEDGDAIAQTSLAFMLQQEQGCKKDEMKIFSLYERAAASKSPLALFNLGILYANGLDGVKHDQFKAYELFQEAAVLEVPQAQYEVGLMLERGLGCLQNFSEAAFWYEEGAKRGSLESFNNLGVLYREGHGVEQNDERSFICFFRAADGGLPEGQFNLGQMYDQGIGVEADNDKALDLCRKAAYGGHEKAKAIIKQHQQDGNIVF